MKKIAALIVAAGACAANAQFAVVSGVNSTDAMRGLNNAEAGDIISVTILASGEVAGNPLFGVFFNILADNATLTNFAYNNPLISTLFSTQIAGIGEFPAGSGVYVDTFSANAGIAIQANFGSNLGADPVNALQFQFEYTGGTATVGLEPLGMNYTNQGLFVTTYDVEGLVVTPAPASAALLGLGGLVAARRRRA